MTVTAQVTQMVHTLPSHKCRGLVLPAGDLCPMPATWRIFLGLGDGDWSCDEHLGQRVGFVLGRARAGQRSVVVESVAL